MSNIRLRTVDRTMEAVLTNISVRPAVRRLNLFKKYLTTWVGLCMVAGVGLGKWAPHLVPSFCRSDLAHDRSDDDESRLCFCTKCRKKAERAVHYPFCQLGREAFFNGISRMAFLPTPVCIMDVAIGGRSIHRRDHHLGRGSLQRRTPLFKCL